MHSDDKLLTADESNPEQWTQHGKMEFRILVHVIFESQIAPGPRKLDISPDYLNEGALV
jgi:hypothetical protein